MDKKAIEELQRKNLKKLGLTDKEIDEVIQSDKEIDQEKTSMVNMNTKKDRQDLILKFAEFVNTDRITKPQSELYFNYNGTEYRLTLAIPRK